MRKTGYGRIRAVIPTLALLLLLLAAVYPARRIRAVEAGAPGAEAEVTGTASEASAADGQTGVRKPLPAYYNLADQGKKPKVRSQGNTGTCWAISAVSALESDLLPERELYFSADHMSLSNGFNVTQDDGGDYYMIMSYLSDWKGPVLEEEDPYGDGVSPEGLRAAVHVQEVRMLRDLPRSAVKQLILQYGAAQSSLCLNRERTDTDDYHYYNALTCAYFDPLMEDVDHDVLVLGWDDAYSRENFRIKPPRDGAWICQNTWGESFGEDGIFYVSYEDRNLLRKGGVIYGRIEDTDNYDHVYENDSLGWQGRQGYEGEECWFAGAFSAGSQKEELSAVGLYSTGPGTVCSVYVIPDFTGEEDLERLGQLLQNTDEDGPVQDAQEADILPSLEETKEQQPDPGEPFLAAQASMNTAGFFTIDLERPAALESGQQFAVAVRIETPGESKPVAVEMVKDSYTENVTLEGRQTWISPDGKIWDNTQKIYLTNVCLKAYTKDIEL